MNCVQHLNHFFHRVEASEQLQPTHISLYLALFQLWNINRFQNPIAASRSELMRLSKIGSYTTYYKCLHDLSDLKWIEYSPSNSIYRGSYFRLKPFETVPKNDTTMDRTPDTGGEVVLLAFNKIKKSGLNNLNRDTNLTSKNYDEQF